MTRIVQSLFVLIATPLMPTIAQVPIDTPQTNLAPISPPASTYAPPASGYGQFDPYAPPSSGGFGSGGTAFGGGVPGAAGGLAPGATTIGPPTPIGPPSTSPAPGGGSFFDNMFSRPTAPPPPSLSPSFGSPAAGPMMGGPVYGPSAGPYDNPNVYGPPVAPQAGAGFPGSAYPSSTPSTLFPSGLFAGESALMTGPMYSAYRLLQGPRFRYTYIGGGSSANDLAINNMDVSLVFAFPNFLYMAQPIYVVPSFSLQLWDGPDGSTGADLPANAYSAFLDTGWQSDPNQMFGTEFGVRLGAFTDFDTWTSKSFRVRGKALAQFRITPFTTLKGGVYYLGRKRVNLLPAFGFLCQPNPYTRYDIFFPEPKIAKYCRTIGTKDVWWYVNGGYGDGSWTITRTSGAEERVDINDLRVATGFEWGDSNSIRAGRRTAFVEIGYVFEREIQYRINTADDIDPGSAFLISAGFGY